MTTRACLLLLLAGALPASAEWVLRDVAAEAGVTRTILCGSDAAKRSILEQNGTGAALLDYDGDGDLDLYLVNGATHEILAGEAPPVRDALYRNEGGDRFLDVTEEAGLGDTGWGMGTAVGDLDRDGDPDLYVTRYGANLLYENLGDGRFREVGHAAGVDDGGWGHSAAFGDIDSDGDLDLYLANNLVFDVAEPVNGGRPCAYREVAVACGPIGFPKQPDRLYRNDGGLRFTDVSESSGIHSPDPQHGLGVAFGDLDLDGRLDLYVANDSGPNFLFRGHGDGTFEETAWLAGVATQNEGRFQAGMGLALGDANGDGLTDIFLTNFSRDHNTLHLNLGEDFFSDDSYASGLGAPSWIPMGWGTRFQDLDQDGDQDLFVANGHIYPEVEGGLEDESYAQPNNLYLNDGKGSFSDGSDRLHRERPPGVSRGVAFGDLDADGDVDLVIQEMGSHPAILRNDDPPGHWLLVALHGLASTPDGEGTSAELTSGSLRQRREATRSGSYLSSSDPRLHFGLGAAARVDRLELRWPSGRRQRFLALVADHEVVAFEGGPSSPRDAPVASFPPDAPHPAPADGR